MTFTKHNLENYLITNFTNTNFISHIENIDNSKNDINSTFNTDTVNDDNTIVFKYLEDFSLSNDIQYQRNYLKEYTLNICVYNIDTTLHLPFIKYFLLFDNNEFKLHQKKLDMKPFIEILENRYKINPISDSNDDSENNDIIDENEISDIDYEFIEQIKSFFTEIFVDHTFNVMEHYKGFLEDEHRNIFLFIEVENIQQLNTKYNYKAAIIDEIIGSMQLLNYPINKSFSNLFKKYSFLQYLKTTEHINVQTPKLCYLCVQNDDNTVQNVYNNSDNSTNMLIYPTITYKEYENMYIFSASPILLDNLNNIRRFVCFVENNDENVDNNSDNNDNLNILNITNISFIENNNIFYGFYDDNFFTEL